MRLQDYAVSNRVAEMGGISPAWRTPIPIKSALPV